MQRVPKAAEFLLEHLTLPFFCRFRSFLLSLRMLAFGLAFFLIFCVAAGNVAFFYELLLSSLFAMAALVVVLEELKKTFRPVRCAADNCNNSVGEKRPHKIKN